MHHISEMTCTHIFQLCACIEDGNCYLRAAPKLHCFLHLGSLSCLGGGEMISMKGICILI